MRVMPAGRVAVCPAGKCSIAECIVYDGNLPTRVHLVPRSGSGAPFTEPRVRLPPLVALCASAQSEHPSLLTR